MPVTNIQVTFVRKHYIIQEAFACNLSLNFPSNLKKYFPLPCHFISEEKCYWKKIPWPSWSYWSWFFNSGCSFKILYVFQCAVSSVPHPPASRLCFHNCSSWPDLCLPLLSFRTGPGLFLLSLLTLSVSMFGSHPGTYVVSSLLVWRLLVLKFHPVFWPRANKLWWWQPDLPTCPFKHGQLGSIPLRQPPVHIYLLPSKHLCPSPSWTLFTAHPTNVAGQNYVAKHFSNHHRADNYQKLSLPTQAENSERKVKSQLVVYL